MLDIEKLHENVQKINNDEILENLTGASTAYKHLMMGEVWLGARENQYVYIGQNPNHINDVCLQFLAMLNEDQNNTEYPKKDIRIIHRRGYHVLVDRQCFIFATHQTASEPIFWAGIHIDRVFIDLNDNRHWIPQDIFDTIIAYGGDIL